MAESKLEITLRKLDVTSKTLEVIRNVYFYKKERKDELIEECLGIIEESVKELKSS